MHLSMPECILAALKRFKRERPRTFQHQPHPHVPIKYGQEAQYVTDDESENVSDGEKKYIQQFLGTFLYYGRAVNPTMLVALSSIATEQALPAKKTVEKMISF